MQFSQILKLALRGAFFNTELSRKKFQCLRRTGELILVMKL